MTGVTREARPRQGTILTGDVARRLRASAQRLLDHDYLLAHVAEDDLRWGMAVEWRDGRRIAIADRARTMVDVLDNPRLGGASD